MKEKYKEIKCVGCDKKLMVDIATAAACCSDCNWFSKLKRE